MKPSLSSNFSTNSTSCILYSMNFCGLCSYSLAREPYSLWNGTPGIAGHFFPAFRDNPPQDPAQQLYVGGTRNFAAVPAACLMVSKEKFIKVGGFSPKFK